MTDPMPRKDVELPPRMPEAATIAELQRALLDARAERDRLRADAQAAQALVVGEAAGAGQAIADAARANAMTEKPGSKARNDMMERCWGAEDAVGAIRALADADGLAAVDALRKERDALKVPYDDLYAGALADAKSDALEAQVARLVGALEALRHAVCGETGFASCVRAHSGKAYPWPALDEAEALVNAALAPADGLAAVEALRSERDALFRRATLAEEWRDHDKARAEKAEAELAAAQQREAGLLGLIRWAHETLWELNPDNYDHDEVCKVNDAAVEVILGLAPVIGETHGYSAEWWAERAALAHNGRGE